MNIMTNMSDELCKERHNAFEKLCDEKHKNLWSVITGIRQTQWAIIGLVGFQIAIIVYDVFINKHVTMPNVANKVNAAETMKGVEK